MINEKYAKMKVVKHSVVYKPKSEQSLAKGMTIYVPKSVMPNPDGPYSEEIQVSVTVGGSGHYRSEMVDVEAERERDRKARAELVASIQAEIDSRGVAEVLADIVNDGRLLGPKNRFRDKGRKHDDR